MKISIIGAGNVGASIAYGLCLRDVCKQIVLVDIFADVAMSKATDIYQSSCVFGSGIKVVGTDNYSLIKDSDIVIITAGSARKEGQSRDDLLIKNANVVATASENIAKFAPKSIIIVVTNPLDVMVVVAFYKSGFDKKRVLGMAGELDSARAIYEISSLKNIPSSDIKAKVIGAHNDQMIISRSNLNIALSDDEFNRVMQETKTGGAKIVKMLGTSAFYAPAAGVIKMCEAIKNQSDEIISASVILADDLACGRLVRLDNFGLKEILPLNISEDEIGVLRLSEEKVVQSVKFLKESAI